MWGSTKFEHISNNKIFKPIQSQSIIFWMASCIFLSGLPKNANSAIASTEILELKSSGIRKCR